MKLPSTKVLAAALTLAFASLPSQTTASHSWGGYHWARTANPFTLKLGDNVNSTWDPILATTSNDWSGSDVLDTVIVDGKNLTTAKRCKPVSGQVEVCNSKYGNNGWLGIAQIWITGGTHITQGVVKVNDTYFNTKTYNSTAWRNLVMCQEVGHTFGLDHQDENFSNANLGTCMDYTNNPESNQHPDNHDFAELEIIYAHLDSTTTIGQSVQSTPFTPDRDMNTRGEWGRLLRTSKNGLKEIYMLDFGHGQKIFTFVRWAEGEGRGR